VRRRTSEGKVCARERDRSSEEIIFLPHIAVLFLCFALLLFRSDVSVSRREAKKIIGKSKEEAKDTKVKFERE
jgi:hypothetical protein